MLKSNILYPPGGSTVVLKSDGAVKQHHADVLGVYRMIDHYNERPVYKQDGGENYIYYRLNHLNHDYLFHFQILPLIQFICF